MALLWIEGFGGFQGDSPPSVLSAKYSVNNGSYMYLYSGRYGGNSLQLRYYNANQPYIETPTLKTFLLGDTLIVGFTYYRPTTLYNDKPMVYLQHSGGGYHVALSMMNGELKVHTPSTSWTTTGLVLPAGTWHYIELKATISDTGAFELRVNGVGVLSQSGVDLQWGTYVPTSVRFLGGSGDYPRYGDIYICDGSGTTNNDFLGPQQVEAIFPNGDVTAQWTPSTPGTHYSLVDENPANGDTDYVESNVSGQTDLFDYGSLSRITSGIKGIQVNSDARCTDGNAQTLLQPVKSGSTQSDGATVAMSSQTYSTKFRIVEQDPATDSAWTASGVNAAQVGLKVG